MASAVSHLKLVIKGCVEALVSSDIVPSVFDTELQRFINAVDEHSYSKIGISGSVCVLLRGHLTNYVNKYMSITSQLESVQKELEKERNKRIFHESALFELQQAVGTNGGLSPMVKMKSSSRSHSQDDEEIMNELVHLEYKSQIKVMQSRMEELQVSYKAELQRLEVAAAERESVLRKTLEAKYTTAIQSDKQLLSEIENQLLSEQSKRKQLQLRFSEEEKKLKSIIADLEKRNLDLQTRAENAENSLTKLRISAR